MAILPLPPKREGGGGADFCLEGRYSFLLIVIVDYTCIFEGLSLMVQTEDAGSPAGLFSLFRYRDARCFVSVSEAVAVVGIWVTALPYLSYSSEKTS